MRYGSPHAAGYGDPENHFAYVIPDRAEMATRGYTSVPVLIKQLSTHVPAWIHVYRNGQKAAQIYDADGKEKIVTLDVPWGSNSMSILALRTGMLSDPAYQMNRVARYFESNTDTGNKLPSLEIIFSPAIVEPERTEGSHTSSWSLSGLVLGGNTARVEHHPTWGRLTFTITVADGICTIELSVGFRVVASGSAAVDASPFTLTLTEENDSGVSGSVTVADTVDDAEGTLDARWPASILIKRDTTDPPTTTVATVPFTGENVVRWSEPIELAAGTYYYRTQPVSDTNKAGTASASQTVIVLGAPAAPTNLAYSSGGVDDLVLSFNRSATAGAAYRLYYTTVQPDGIITLNYIRDTAIAGTPGAAATISLSEDLEEGGTLGFILRAVNGGVEEKNLNMLLIEFDGAGARVPPRPNTPGINPRGITWANGLDATIPVTYDPTKEKGTATEIQIFTRTEGGAYDFDTPAATTALSAASDGSTLKRANVPYTFPLSGYFYIKALAATADGTLSVAADAAEIQILASDATLPAQAFTVGLSRS